MERLGSKTAARELAARAGVPPVPGAKETVASATEAAEIAQGIGYPVVLKAVAGGGGKGMRVVAAANEMDAAWRDAGSEALNAFGDANLYLEKYLARPRHIEIQFFGDEHGHVVHLGERECSVQRRHQKVVEEAPSPAVTPELRRAMGEAAVRLACEANYGNAGTAEFLVDDSGRFYFLEVNARLQVEHPVTELVTGLDLVKLQLRVAAGEPLPLAQSDMVLRGHAIECRIYAEDPENHFFPSPGKILTRTLPAGPGIRLDDGVYPGWKVSSEYDPLLGKLIAWGADRGEAIARMRRALDEYFVTGIHTNTQLFRRILADAEFQRGEIHTRWLDERLGSLLAPPAGESARDRDLEDAAIVAAIAWQLRTRDVAGKVSAQAESTSRWKAEARREQVDREPPR
jgi:acetyl-CoA carboxylase biotin carboxylase subunit